VYSNKSTKYNCYLKERLKFFASKTIYLPNTLEFKYANEINEVIEKFNFNEPKTVLDLDSYYNLFLNHIKDLFTKYKKEVLENIPEFFVNVFEPINDARPFDCYANEVNEIRIKYEKIDKALDQIILSMFNDKIFEEIIDFKKIIIKEIINNKITLEDGKHKLQAEIKIRISKRNNKIWDTYKVIMNNFNKRMMELKPIDTENIDIAIKMFVEVMTTLKAVQCGFKDENVLYILRDLTFTNSDELKESKYELYITANISDDEEPEIVLKTGEENNLVFFLKKFPSGMTEKLYMSKEYFYKKYCKLKDALKNLDFLEDRCYAHFSHTVYNAIVLYHFENAGCFIILTENNEILIVSSNVVTVSPFIAWYGINTGEKYKDKQLLYDKIYNSFFEREEEIKLKRDKNKDNS